MLRRLGAQHILVNYVGKPLPKVDKESNSVHKRCCIIIDSSIF